MSFNKALLLGNLGKDPETRMTQGGGMAVCNFSLATSSRRKDASGTWVDQTEWHNIVCFGKTAENAQKFLKKGSQALIEGKIQTRKWQDKEGKDRYTTEIVADTVTFVGSRAQNTGASTSSNVMSDKPMVESVTASEAAAAVAEPFQEDDIPF
jgi:single-strand DNA-binding protein